MKISIITVVLNRKDSILRAMNSVINQKYENKEYIVLDGGSTDGTFELVKSNQDKIDFFKSQKDKNLYDALNKALELATGDIIGFMHSDDYYSDENVLTDISEAFLNNDADLVCGGIKYLRDEKISRQIPSIEIDMKNILLGKLPPHPAIFFKKDVIKDIGNFDDNLTIIADLDWCIRVAKKGFKTYKLKKYIYLMNIGGESTLTLKNSVNRAKEYINVALRYNILFLFSFFLKGMRKFLKIS